MFGFGKQKEVAYTMEVGYSDIDRISGALFAEAIPYYCKKSVMRIANIVAIPETRDHETLLKYLGFEEVEESA